MKCKTVWLLVFLHLFPVILASSREKTEPTIREIYINTLKTLNDDLEAEKTYSEIKKLQAEIESLQITNKSIGPATKWFSTMLGAIGGVLGAIIALLIYVFGRSLSNKFTETQDAKLQQDKDFAREKHMLELFEKLAQDNPKLQLAAASVLLQRLCEYNTGSVEPRDVEREKPIILQVLMDVLKDPQAPETLLKIIADRIVIGLEAKVPDRMQPQHDKPSPIEDLDFQKTRIINAWWKRIDARGIDFFDAKLINCGLREAFLNNAVFFHASLEGSTLREANLTDCDLREANLAGCDLRGAKLEGAKLEGATYDSSTKWPSDFNPDTFGAIRV